MFFPGHGAATVLIAAVTSLVAGAFRCGTWLEIVTRRAGLLPALVLAPGLLLDALTLAGLPAALPPAAWWLHGPAAAPVLASYALVGLAMTLATDAQASTPASGSRPHGTGASAWTQGFAKKLE